MQHESRYDAEPIEPYIPAAEPVNDPTVNSPHFPYAKYPKQMADFLDGFSDFVTREETRTALLAAAEELRKEPS